MNRALVNAHLTLAERHVREGDQIVERQRRLVEELERDGHDTTTAVQLLRTFESTQAGHVAELERLRAEAADVNRE